MAEGADEVERGRNLDAQVGRDEHVERLLQVTHLLERWMRRAVGKAEAVDAEAVGLVAVAGFATA